MFTLVFLLVASLNPQRSAAASASFADDVVHVVLTEPPLFEGDVDEAKLETARLLGVFAEGESNGEARALGDGGASCGVTQLGFVARAGHSCESVRADRRLGLRLGLRWMIRMRNECGSVARGLGAFASGRCGGAAALVRRRCAAASVICE